MPSHQARQAELHKKRLLEKIKKHFDGLNSEVPVQNLNQQPVKALEMMVRSIDRQRRKPG